MPKQGDAMLVGGLLMQLFSVLKSLLGVLQGLPGMLLSGLVILFAVLLRRTAMSVGRIVV